MTYRRRTPPEMTAALCVHMPSRLRKAVEEFADSEKLSLAEAARELLERGLDC